MGDIDLKARESGVKDPLGRVYEYFLSRFAAAEGKGGGEFYTPQCVVQLLVEMIEPYRSRVYAPCCGSGGMFVQSEKFVEEHGGKLGHIAIYGQESNPTTWRLAKMNLAIRRIDADLGPHHADTSLSDKGEIVGQQVSARTLDELADELRRIEPPVFPDVETIPLRGNRAVITLSVPGSGGHTSSMTVPDKPRSSKQKYRLSAKGLAVVQSSKLQGVGGDRVED